MYSSTIGQPALANVRHRRPQLEPPWAELITPTIELPPALRATVEGAPINECRSERNQPFPNLVGIFDGRHRQP
jgi:hypothetical protein